ncbi:MULTISPECIES: hypothetical protein [Helicobacter]|uniref:Uncharacterized protein n=1 Tax=Helicobacter ganmani TaxID=60246 RepID=A0A3D8IH18_9HELI|nr:MULTISPECIES: hypothetical protein [Helicobacter]MBD5165627.1 hypothetical protein [Helicobacter sp.]RDU64265.1 hypothetical protein CQA43_00120 [Helicobacter ganmani]
MKSKVLEIKNSEKILYLALGLFSNKDSLEVFLNKYHLKQITTLKNQGEAKKYCNYALHFGLVAEIKKKFK